MKHKTKLFYQLVHSKSVSYTCYWALPSLTGKRTQSGLPKWKQGMDPLPSASQGSYQKEVEGKTRAGTPAQGNLIEDAGVPTVS